MYDQDVVKKYLNLAYCLKLNVKNVKFKIIYQHMNVSCHISHVVLGKGLLPWCLKQWMHFLTSYLTIIFLMANAPPLLEFLIFYTV